MLRQVPWRMRSPNEHLSTLLRGDVQFCAARCILTALRLMRQATARHVLSWLERNRTFYAGWGHRRELIHNDGRIHGMGLSI